MTTSNNASYQAMRAHLITVIDAWPGDADHAAVIAARMYAEQTCDACGALVNHQGICQACRMISYVRATHPHQLRQLVISNAADAAWQAAIAGVTRAQCAVGQLQQVSQPTARTLTYLAQLLHAVAVLSAETLAISDLMTSVIVIDT